MNEKFWADWQFATVASRWDGEVTLTVEDLYQEFKARMEAERRTDSATACPRCKLQDNGADKPLFCSDDECPQRAAGSADACLCLPFKPYPDCPVHGASTVSEVKP